MFFFFYPPKLNYLCFFVISADLREIIRWDIDVGLQRAQVWWIRSTRMRGRRHHFKLFWRAGAPKQLMQLRLGN